ncbi:MAG: shikimate dehydrogenase [Anaerolineae bacterium]
MSSDFAFVIHPIEPKKHVGRRYPLLGRVLTEPMIDFFCQYWPPVKVSRVESARSQDTGENLNGWLVAAPYTPKMMLNLPVEQVYYKLVATGRLAERMGARILGLGALAAVVGDAGVTVAERLDIPVTTGDSYTVTIVTDAIEQAGRQMGIDLRDATAAIVGATGAIGGASAQLLAAKTGQLVLIGRREKAVERSREKCEGGSAKLITSTDLHSMHTADLILSVTSSIAPIIEPEHLKPGAVVCDVAVPKDVSRRVLNQRKDVLVIEGGIVAVPGPVDFHFNFGCPPGYAYACLAETMALAMEGRFEDYTVGRFLNIDQVREITEIAARHGFKLGKLTSFNREVTAAQIAEVRERAEVNLRTWGPATT